MTDQEMFYVLSRWNYWDRRVPDDLVDRAETKHLLDFAEGNLVQVIKGPRRAGKSSLLKLFHRRMIEHFEPAAFLFINLEDVALSSEPQTYETLERLYRLYRQRVYPTGKAFVFIDEIQKINGWERWVETYRELGEARFIVTGSSSVIGPKELGTVLTGRHIDLTLYPFSFSDYLSAKGMEVDSRTIVSKRDLIKNELHRYVTVGGFPEALLNYEPDEAEKLLETYFDDMIYRDIVDRWGVRDIHLLRSIAVFCLSNSGNLVTYRRLQRMLEQSTGKASINTISEHMRRLAEAYLVFESPFYTNSVRRASLLPRKVYSVDVGLRKAVVKPVTEDYGREAENIVYVELLRRGYGINYWKSEKTEVDLVAVKKGRNLVVNVTSSNLENESLMQRELKGLSDFPHKSFERLLITGDLEDTLVIGSTKVSAVPLYKWLLLEDLEQSEV